MYQSVPNEDTVVHTCHCLHQWAHLDLHCAVFVRTSAGMVAGQSSLLDERELTVIILGWCSHLAYAYICMRRLAVHL